LQAQDLTEKQRETLEEAIRFTEEHGFAPTNIELAPRLGLKTAGAVRVRILRLYAKGYVDLREDVSRGLVCRQDPQGYAIEPGLETADDEEEVEPLDEEEQRVLSCILAQLGGGSLIPSMLEMGARTGMSTTKLSALLASMQRKGYLTSYEGKSRAISVHRDLCGRRVRVKFKRTEDDEEHRATC